MLFNTIDSNSAYGPGQVPGPLGFFVFMKPDQLFPSLYSCVRPLTQTWHLSLSRPATQCPISQVCYPWPNWSGWTGLDDPPRPPYNTLNRTGSVWTMGFNQTLDSFTVPCDLLLYSVIFSIPESLLDPALGPTSYLHNLPSPFPYPEPGWHLHPHPLKQPHIQQLTCLCDIVDMIVLT